MRALSPQERRAIALLREQILPELSAGRRRDINLTFAAAFRRGWWASASAGENPIAFGVALASEYLELMGVPVGGRERAMLGRLVASFGVGAFYGIEEALRRELEGGWFPYAWAVAKNAAAEDRARALEDEEDEE